jgi:hypothetical protein
VVLRSGAFEEVEFDESRHGIEIDITGQPHVLESGFTSSDDPESVHGNEHGLYLTLICPDFQRRKAGMVGDNLCLANPAGEGAKKPKQGTFPMRVLAVAPIPVPDGRAQMSKPGVSAVGPPRRNAGRDPSRSVRTFMVQLKSAIGERSSNRVRPKTYQRHENSAPGIITGPPLTMTISAIARQRAIFMQCLRPHGTPIRVIDTFGGPIGCRPRKERPPDIASPTSARTGRWCILLNALPKAIAETIELAVRVPSPLSEGRNER